MYGFPWNKNIMGLLVVILMFTIVWLIDEACFVLNGYLRRKFQQQLIPIIPLDKSWEPKRMSAKTEEKPTGIYIVHFQDDKWRVFACRNIDDIQSLDVLPIHAGARKKSPFYFEEDYLKGAPSFAMFFDAVAAAKAKQKLHPGLEVYAYPGKYRPPYEYGHNSRHYPSVG